LKAALPWVLLSVLVLIPLYAISAAVAIRSGLFNLDNKEISGEEYKALWALVGSGLATAATVIGLLITRTNNQRTSKQLELDTAIKGLGLIVMDNGEYAPKARTAGALSTLVHLGHPVIAMGTLAVVWEEEAVDPATACWLISEVFDTGCASSKIEAAQLLRQYASTLSLRDAGVFEWPHALYHRWPIDLPRDARLDCMFAIVELVLSKDREWWGSTPSMAISLLDEAFTKDPDISVQESSGLLLKAFLANEWREVVVSWGPGDKSMSEIVKRVSSYDFGLRWTEIEDLTLKIAAWMEPGIRQNHADTSSLGPS
jgi:hypothetical protein